MYKRKDGTELTDQQTMALVMAESAVRNSLLEELHAGTYPDSATGDYSDVKVVSPYGEIPWTKLSRISDAEMKRLMIDITDRIYTLISHPEALRTFSRCALENWKKPELLEGFRQLLADETFKARQ